MDILREQSSTLQRAYNYTMKSDRVDRFQSDWQFREQLIDSLNAKPVILETKKADIETGESEGSKKATNSTEANSKEGSDEINIEL